MFSADEHAIEIGVPIPEKPPQALITQALLMQKVDLVVSPTNCLPVLFCSFHTWPSEHHGLRFSLSTIG